MMEAQAWEKTIVKCMKTAGTYQKQYDSAINSLADILEQRDRVYEQFVEEGSQATVIKISDRGAENSVKNPLLAIWMELNRDALAYWRELGLTPGGLKKINESAVKAIKNVTALEKALAKMG